MSVMPLWFYVIVMVWVAMSMTAAALFSHAAKHAPYDFELWPDMYQPYTVERMKREVEEMNGEAIRV